MIKDVGAEWVILGHSERRNVFNETDAVSINVFFNFLFQSIINFYGTSLLARNKCPNIVSITMI